MAKNNKSTAAADDAHKPLYNKIDCSGFKLLSNLIGPPKKENKRHSWIIATCYVHHDFSIMINYILYIRFAFSLTNTFLMQFCRVTFN
jgi:hypothetical protein